MNTVSVDEKIINLIKLNIIENAVNYGWCVSVINDNTFVLKKHMNNLLSDEINTDTLIDKILNVTNFVSFDKNIDKDMVV